VREGKKEGSEDTDAIKRGGSKPLNENPGCNCDAKKASRSGIVNPLQFNTKRRKARLSKC
jgi:hypothetical protein